MERIKCAKCEGGIHDSPDNLVLCAHHKGFVHMGCCMYDCSQDGTPCMHAMSIYRKE